MQGNSLENITMLIQIFFPKSIEEVHCKGLTYP